MNELTKKKKKIICGASSKVKQGNIEKEIIKM